MQLATLILAFTFISLPVFCWSGYVPADTLILPRSIDTRKPQIGINGIVVDESQELEPQVKELRKKLEDLGVQIIRMVNTGMFWDRVNPRKGVYNWKGAYPYLKNIHIMGNCYRKRFSCHVPSWSEEWLKPDNKWHLEYLKEICEQYGDYITFWEPGYENVIWDDYKAELAGKKASDKDADLPWARPRKGIFSPEDLARMYRYFNSYIKRNDEDAIILYPGIRWQGKEDEAHLKRVLKHLVRTDLEGFSLHLYCPWQETERYFNRFKTVLAIYRMENKRLIISETGLSSDGNGQMQQAADIFRKFSQLFEMGAEMILWNTLADTEENPGFGLFDKKGKKKASWYSYRLFSHKLVPFVKCSRVRRLGKNIYAFHTFQGTKYVLWAEDSCDCYLEVPYKEARIIRIAPEWRNEKFQFFVEEQEADARKLYLHLDTVPILVEEKK